MFKPLGSNVLKKLFHFAISFAKFVPPAFIFLSPSTAGQAALATLGCEIIPTYPMLTQTCLPAGRDNFKDLALLAVIFITNNIIYTTSSYTNAEPLGFPLIQTSRLDFIATDPDIS